MEEHFHAFIEREEERLLGPVLEIHGQHTLGVDEIAGDSGIEPKLDERLGRQGVLEAQTATVGRTHLPVGGVQGAF